VRESYREGPSSHSGPESCTGGREAVVEADRQAPLNPGAKSRYLAHPNAPYGMYLTQQMRPSILNA
jgi:hypothetical protein